MYPIRKQIVSAVAVGLIAALAVSVWAGPAEDQYTVGAAHYSRGRWKLAAEEFRVFLDRYPDHERADLATFFLGEALVQLGRYDEARQCFLRFLERAPGHRYARQARFRTGETAYLTGKRAEANRELARFRKDFPDDPLDAYVLPYLGELALDARDAPGAERYFTEALERFPDGSLADEARFGLGRAYQIEGKAEQAAQFYRYLAEKENGPLADDARFRLALVQYNGRRYAEAIETLKVFDQKFHDSRLRGYARYWLGMAHLARKDWLAAAEILGSTADQDAPKDLAPAMAFYAGEALAAAGKLEQADRHYDRVLSGWPESRWADDSARGKVGAALKRKDYDAVIALADEFDRDYKNSPLRPFVRQTLGRALVKQAKYDEAIAVFRELLQSPAPRPAPTDAEKSAGTVDAEKSAGTVDAGTLDAGTVDAGTVHYLLALAYLGRNRYEDALQSLSQFHPPKAQPALVAGAEVARASALIGLGKYTDAIEPLRAYLALQPDGPDAAKSRAELAVAQAESGRFDEAEKTFGQFYSRHGKDPLLLPTAYYLAEKAYKAGRYPWARWLFTLLARDGNPPEYVAKGRLGLAWTQLQEGDPTESAATFERLVKEDPDSPMAQEAALARAKVLEKLGKHDAALAMYQWVIDAGRSGKPMSEALQGAARLHDLLSQKEEAAALLARLVKEYPQLPDLDAVLYRQAWVMVDLGRPDDAEKVFSRISSEYPKSRFWADATYRLAERAAATGRPGRAEQLADRILDAEPEGEILAYTLYLKGQLAARVFRWTDVASPMERLVAEQPDSPLRLPAEYWIAESLYRQGKYDEAGRRFDDLAPQIHGRDQPWLAMVPLRRAQVRAQQEKWTEAHDIAAAIPKEYPSFSQQYEVDYLLGRCLAAQAQFAKAREAYERVTRSPTGAKTETAAMAQWMIGETYFHQKSYDEAIRAYLRVEPLYDFPRWQAAALLQAGKCDEMQGRWRQAVERYAHLLKEYPKTDFTEEASRRLRVAQERATMSPSNE